VLQGLFGHRLEAVDMVAYQPTRGERLAFPGALERRTLTGHTGAMTAVTITPDGSWPATGGTEATVRIWTWPPPHLSLRCA
jgi:WD40 repeat protein